MQRGSRYRLHGYGDLKNRDPVGCGKHGCHDRLGITQTGVACSNTESPSVSV